MTELEIARCHDVEDHHLPMNEDEEGNAVSFFGGIPKGGRATQTDNIKFLSESLSCESGQRNTKYIF